MSTRRSLLEIAQKNHKATLAVQIVAAISAVAMVSMAHGVDTVWYLDWLGVVFLVCALRVGVNQALKQQLDRPKSSSDGDLKVYGLWHCAGLIVSGGLWAIFAWQRLGPENDNARFVIIIIVSALAAGATGVLAPLRRTGRLYISLMLVPASLALIIEQSPQSLLGFIGLAFWAVMLVGHNTNHRLIMRSLELGQENADLVAELKARNDEILGINLSMERRIAERISALQDYAIKARAESRAKEARLEAIERVMSRFERTLGEDADAGCVRALALSTLREISDLIGREEESRRVEAARPLEGALRSV